MRIRFGLLILFTIFFSSAYAQLGIRGGVNMSEEDYSFSQEGIKNLLNPGTLTGYNVGFVYQVNPKKSGFGFEIGALMAQKGGTFEINENNIAESIIRGYNEINYVEVPLSLRLKLNIGGAVSLIGSAGAYGAYALEEKTVLESDVKSLLYEETFDDFLDRIDYGYSYGAGIEFVRKLQITVSWNKGLQKVDPSKKLIEILKNEHGLPSSANLTANKINNHISISLTYLLW